MIIYTVLTVLNLLGMGYLFYVSDIQKRVNAEFLDNAMMNNITHIIVKQKVEELEKQIEELQKQSTETNKK